MCYSRSLICGRDIFDIRGPVGRWGVLTQRALWQSRDYVVLTKQRHCLARKYDLTEKFILFE